MQRMAHGTNVALRVKDEQARAALTAQRESFERVTTEWSREVKDVASVKVAQAKIDDRNRASRTLNAELHEERRVGKLTLQTAEQLVKDEAAAELQMSPSAEPCHGAIRPISCLGKERGHASPATSL